MKTTLPLALIIVGLLSTGPATPAAHAQGTNVAVVDMAEVFKKHTRFQAQMEDVRKDIQGFEAFYRQKRTDMGNLVEKMREVKSGSPEYKTMETQLASMEADLQVQTQLKRREFMEQEARVRYNAYQEVVSHVARFASRHGIELVLRFDGQEIDPTNPQSVQLGWLRSIVYHNKRDITNFVVEEVNKGQAPTNVSSRPAIPQRQ